MMGVLETLLFAAMFMVIIGWPLLTYAADALRYLWWKAVRK